MSKSTIRVEATYIGDGSNRTIYFTEYCQGYYCEGPWNSRVYREDNVVLHPILEYPPAYEQFEPKDFTYNTDWSRVYLDMFKEGTLNSIPNGFWTSAYAKVDVVRELLENELITKEDFLQIHNGVDFIHPLHETTPTKQCAHTWAMYDSGWSRYEYCSICDERKKE